ncbi:hypothetical protein C2G38_2186739 [Gigaspora rosea]|uniref:J domain-containing protein n=1 Tax=Gigaspora rosea TaxID=44941 RepID=A0A397VCE4_9GLOM|nr:hypothetical protein C2G38_2186739 [Gigaspora rosea]
MPRVKKSEFYKTLEIKSNATLYEIKQAYKKLVLVHHPDRNVNKSENECVEAEKKFKEIQEAYEYLTTNYKESKKRTPTKKKTSNKTKPQKNKRASKKTESKQEIKINKEFKKIKQIKEINQVQQKENSNNLITQNNETLLVQVSNHVQVEDINKDNYMTEEEIEEVVIETNQVLLYLNAKESIIDLNIQDEISLRIEGKCILNFN